MSTPWSANKRRLAYDAKRNLHSQVFPFWEYIYTAYSRGGIKYLWPSNWSLEKSKQTDKMMKTILLLAFAVFVSGAHLKNNLLGEIFDELNATPKTLLEVRFNISIVTIISQNCLYFQILSRAWLQYLIDLLFLGKRYLPERTENWELWGEMNFHCLTILVY